MSQPERVLIVEDDGPTRDGLAELVRTWGFVTEAAANGEEALKLVTSFRPSIVVTDMVMPKMDGMQLLKALKEEAEQLKIIMLTAQGSVETAVEALKNGAQDYLTKPVDPQKLRLLLQHFAELGAQKRENEALRRQLREKGSFGRIVGHSQKMRRIYQVIEQAAPTTASVLIIGESGTGKELVAQTIHQLSPRDATRRSSPSTARRFPRRCSRARSSGTSAARSPARSIAGPAASSSPIAARCFSTRSPRWCRSTQVKLLRVLQERALPPARRPDRAGGGRSRARRHQHGSGRGDERRQAPRRSRTTA